MQAFSKCDALKSVKLPDGLESVGAWAFQECRRLEEVILGKNTAYIGDRAFQN